jgi:hypothetical protein
LEGNELLVKFAHARERLLQIIRDAVDLRGHSIQARVRIGLHILHGLLQGHYVAGHFIDRVHGFFHVRLGYRGSLQLRRFSIFLALVICLTLSCSSTISLSTAATGGVPSKAAPEAPASMAVAR